MRDYIASRQEEGAEAATINRELAIVKRMFYLGMECTPRKVKFVPHIPMFTERNTRKGFLESNDYQRLAAECAKIGLWLRTIFELGFTFGWREQEILGLQVRQVDLFDGPGTVSLDQGSTKNDDGRVVVMTRPVRELLTECICGKGPNDSVFTRNFVPVRDFRKAWYKVCCGAGVGLMCCPTCSTDDEPAPVDAKGNCAVCSLKWPIAELKYSGLIFHDLRRTAARNLVRAGVSETVAMKITGHRTSSIFRRYDITALSDLSLAAQKIETSHREARMKNGSGDDEFCQSFDRVGPKSTTTSAPSNSPTLAVTLPN